MTLNAALVTASRSLNLFSLGIQISGNNISNANTPGYVRNHLVIEDGKPYRVANLLIGTGAFAVGIQQDVDTHLEGRLQQANGDYSLSLALGDALKQLEGTLQSLGDNDLSASLSGFVNTIQSVVNQPEDPSIRLVTISEGQNFADAIRNLRTKIDQLTEGINVNLNAQVEKANQLLEKVRELNPQISQSEANGLNKSDAGGLRNLRSAALTELSEIIPIRVVDRPDGGIDVYTGSDYLLLGGELQTLEVSPRIVDGIDSPQVQTSSTNALLDGNGGLLTGLMEGRDAVIHGFRQQLNQFTAAVISHFNQVHASGEGTRGFTSVTGTYAVNSSTSALNAAGLTFPPRNGSFEIKIQNLGTGLSETTQVPVNLDGIGAETSLTSLQSALNGIAHVTAAITADGRLQIQTDSGFELRFANDTSGTLAALGVNTFFTGTDSANIQVNDVLKQDASLLATGRGGGPADNRNAVELATVFDQARSEFNQLSIRDFYQHAKADVAQQSAAQNAVAEGLAGFRDVLSTQREQQSGVSLDEELIKILQFQHSYQAAARIISTVEDLMQTLLNI